jgi:hypothetical protein
MRAQQRRRRRAGQFWGAQADPAAAAAAVRAALFQGSEPQPASARPPICISVAQWSLKGCQRRVAKVCHTQLGARSLSPVFSLRLDSGGRKLSAGDQRDSPGRRLYNVSSAVVLVSCSQPRGVRPLPAFVARAEIIALARFGTRSTATPPLLPAGEFRSARPLCVCVAALPSLRPPGIRSELGQLERRDRKSFTFNLGKREIDGFAVSARAGAFEQLATCTHEYDMLCGSGPSTRHFKSCLSNSGTCNAA